MKIKHLIALVLAGFCWTNANAATTVPRLKMAVFPTCGVSASSPHITGNRSNIMRGIQGLPADMDVAVNPEAWNPAEILRWPYLMTSLDTAFSLWMGTNSPTGSFAGELGNRILWSLAARSTNGLPFPASGIKFEIKCSNSGFIPTAAGYIATNSVTGAEIRYSSTFVGKNWGADGIDGNSDDLIYANGESSTNLVHELYYIGPRTAIGVRNVPEVTAARNIVLAPGFQFTVTFRFIHNNVTRSTGVVIFSTDPLLIARRNGNILAMEVLGQPTLSYSMESATNASGAWIPRGEYLDGAAVSQSPLLPREFFRLSLPETAPFSIFSGALLGKTLNDGY